MKTGELKNIGTHPLGHSIYEYYECVDCKTAYPVIRGFPSCNGERIGRCPYCKPQPKNNLCGLPDDAAVAVGADIYQRGKINGKSITSVVSSLQDHKRAVVRIEKQLTTYEKLFLN